MLSVDSAFNLFVLSIYPSHAHIFLKDIEDEIVNQIIGLLLHLDNEDSESPIHLYINCGGGSLIAGLALFDAMNHIQAPVSTVNLGLAASVGSFLLAAGAKGKRLALPHSRVMIHQPMGKSRGFAEDIKVRTSCPATNVFGAFLFFFYCDCLHILRTLLSSA